IFMAATAWATILGVIWAINYGLEYFGVKVPLNVSNIIGIVNTYLPGIVGVVVGFINYGKVLELEG
ncbi:MAG: hypothetical protein N2D54_02380, partial [Chloroflexota bacterium]